MKFEVTTAKWSTDSQLDGRFFAFNQFLGFGELLDRILAGSSRVRRFAICYGFSCLQWDQIRKKLSHDSSRLMRVVRAAFETGKGTNNQTKPQLCVFGVNGSCSCVLSRDATPLHHRQQVIEVMANRVSNLIVLFFIAGTLFVLWIWFRWLCFFDCRFWLVFCVCRWLVLVWWNCFILTRCLNWGHRFLNSCFGALVL